MWISLECDNYFWSKLIYIQVGGNLVFVFNCVFHQIYASGSNQKKRFIYYCRWVLVMTANKICCWFCRSEVERVREKQASVDNKGIIIFLICIIFSLLALVRLFTEMAVSVCMMASSVDTTTEKSRKFCWTSSSSWIFLLVSCILALFILSL